MISFQQKTNQKVITGSFVIFAFSWMYITLRNADNIYYIFANSLTLISAFSFCYLNARFAQGWIKNKGLNYFFLISTLPFLGIYIASLNLYILYITDLLNSSFNIAYLYKSAYPYQSSIELPILYISGIMLSFIKRDILIKTLKIGFATIVTIGIGIFIYTQFLSLDKIEGVQVIEEKYSSIEEIVSLPEFENKIVFVDMWYSSCTSCIEQMTDYLPQFKREMKDEQLEVEYLYIGRETSGPMSKKLWWNAIEKLNLKGWHYYAEKNEAKNYWKTILPTLKKKGKRAYGYPHYLIAKNGKIMDYDAPYPQYSEQIKSILLSQ